MSEQEFSAEGTKYHLTMPQPSTLTHKSPLSMKICLTMLT